MFRLILLLFVLNVMFTTTTFCREFPNLPDTYTTNIEVKTHWKDRFIVYVAKEHRVGEKHAYYFETFHPSQNASIDNRNATTTTANSSSPSSHHRRYHPIQMAVFFDFDQGRARVIDVTGGRKICRRTYNTTRHVKDVADVSTHPGVTTSQLFGDTKSNSYTYMGISTVRNLSCHYWQRRIENETVDYHFLETDKDMKLVQIVESNTGYHRDSVLDYFGFRNVTPNMEEMEPPLGTYCGNNSNMDKLLPSIPNQMTFSVEYRPESMRRNYTHRWFVANYKIYWNRATRMIRADHHILENGKWTPVIDVTDNEKGFRYESFSPTKCRVLEAENNAVSVTPYFKNKRHWVRAREAFEHLMQYRDDFVYEGEHFVRGVPTDVWIYKSDSLGQNGFNQIEWYFTQPNVTEVSSLGKDLQKFVPVRIVGYLGNGTSEYFEMDLLDFRHETFAEDFENPIRNCLKVTDRFYTVQLFVLGVPAIYLEYVPKLKDTIMEVVQNFTMEKSRGRFMIEMMASPDHMNVLLSILPLATESMDKVASIARTIESEVMKKTISFDYKVNDTVHVATFSRGFLDQKRLICKSNDDDDSNNDLVTILAFLIVFFFFFGILLSFGIVKFIIKRNGHNLNKMLRTRQKLDNEQPAATNNANQDAGGDQELKVRDSQN